jgi:hypothetical protein
MKEPFEKILEWMMAGGVQDVRAIDVFFAHAMLLARNMEKEVNNMYTNCSNPNNACHK